MTWKGWEDFAPPRTNDISATVKISMISAVQGENIKDLSRTQAESSTPKRSKYHAEPTVVDGIRFASQKESVRYAELKLLEKAGEIWDFEVQPRFPLLVVSTTGTLIGAGKALAGTFDGRIGEYRGDFAYKDRSGRVVEDVKGMDTPLSKWKRRHVAAQYGIEVRIV